MLSDNKRKFQVSFTNEQFEILRVEAAKRGLTKSCFLLVIFQAWLEKNKRKR